MALGATLLVSFLLPNIALTWNSVSPFRLHDTERRAGLSVIAKPLFTLSQQAV